MTLSQACWRKFGEILVVRVIVPSELLFSGHS